MVTMKQFSKWYWTFIWYRGIWFQMTCEGHLEIVLHLHLPSTLWLMIWFLAQGPSAHVPLLFGTTFHYLSVQPPSEEVSKHTFSTWPFPRRHWCAQLPVDVTERLQRLRIWTPIWLLRHWAWLRLVHWRYINLIDWLIDSWHHASWWAGIAERVSALDWLSLRYTAIIALRVSNPGLCP